jgi:hypothetical protein
MKRLEQISKIVDQVYALDLGPMEAINQIAQILDEAKPVEVVS